MATTLSCMTYYLVKNPVMMKRLKDEVRSAFTHYDEITATSAAPLNYLKAIAQEAMRIHPPLPFALPRVVSEGGSTVDGHFLPGGVCFLYSLDEVTWDVFKADVQLNLKSRPLFRPAFWQPVYHPPTSPTLGSLIQIDGLSRIQPMTSRLVNRFPLALVDAWDEGES